MRRSAVGLMVLMVALALSTACSRAPDDQAIANTVKAKFYADAQLKTADLDVTSKEGEVTLSGEVPSEAARYQAFKLALDTEGVKKVNDQMTVKVAEAEPQPEHEPAPAPVRRSTPRRTTPVVRQDPAPPPPPPPAPVAAAQPAPAPVPAAPPEPQPVEVEIPAGTSLVVRMIDSIDSEVNRTGEVFRASLDEPIMSHGDVVIPSGADVFVKLIEARSAGRLAGRSELQLELVRLQHGGKSYLLRSSTYEQVGTSRGKRTAATIGGGAAIGAAIGAIAGGGKGAAIGAAVGGAGGTAVQVLTKGQQIRVPSETRLEFRLEAPLDVKYFPGENQSRRRP